MGSPQKDRSRRRSRFRIGRGRRQRNNASTGLTLHKAASLDDVQEEPIGSELAMMPSVRRSLSLSPSENMDFSEDDGRSTVSTSSFIESEADTASTATGAAPMSDLDGLLEADLQETGDVVNLQEAVQVWARDTHALIHSSEMNSFVSSSGMILGQASQAVLHVAMLPVSVPMNVLSQTTSLVGHVLVATTTALDRVLDSTKEAENPVDALVKTISSVTPLALHVVNQFKDELGSTLLGLLTASSTPMLEGDCRHESTTGASRNTSFTDENPSAFLDRLRLDCPTYPDLVSRDGTDETTPDEESPEQDETPQTSPRSSDVTKLLLRVCDLGLTDQDDRGRLRSLHCIDLSVEYATPELTLVALDALISRSLALVCTNPETQIGEAAPRGLVIDWKPENGTERHLKKRASLKANDWIARLSKHVLVWSGKFRDRHAVPHGDVPLFLSRGVLSMSPRALLDLFWDNDSCYKYNKYSAYRTTLISLEDDLDKCTRARGTKIVRSETQVPFTGMGVVMATLMHARKVDTAEGPCYMIVSRSVHPGKAGVHYGGHHKKSHSKSVSKNELLWGINIIRGVPNRPNLCELTAFSQIKSGIVPPFLTHRVGVMAVENCFSALREL